VRSGPGREAGLRRNPYPGAVRLAELSSGKAKPLTQTSLRLIPLSRVGLGWGRPYPLTPAGLNGLAVLTLNSLLYKFKSSRSKFKFKLRTTSIRKTKYRSTPGTHKTPIS
jgi:hypothetical protein